MQVEVVCGTRRNRHIAATRAIRAGIAQARDKIVLRDQTSRPDALAVYGWCDPATEYRGRGIPVVTMDMPWFGRLPPSEAGAYVKVSVNHWHPTAYFQRRAMPDDRWQRHGLPILPMRQSGGHIVVAGSGPKSSVRDGNEFQAWEREAIATLRTLTDRPIVYRPKPYMKHAAPPEIEGATMDRETPIAALLQGAHAVVTRQSNVAVDALRLGVPVFCWEGVASVLALQGLADIEQPFLPSDDQRRQFFADLAYCQWTMAELRSGAAWSHLKTEGLIP